MFRETIGGLVLLLSTSLAFSAAPLPQADTQARYDAIKALGALNGVALQCRYIDEVRRMKQAVVLYAPKERSFGLAFDESTNEGFMAFIRQKDTCPNPDNFKRQVGHQIDAIQQTFSGE